MNLHHDFFTVHTVFLRSPEVGLHPYIHNPCLVSAGSSATISNAITTAERADDLSFYPAFRQFFLILMDCVFPGPCHCQQPKLAKITCDTSARGHEVTTNLKHPAKLCWRTKPSLEVTIELICHTAT